jgi:hypothetical protein
MFNFEFLLIPFVFVFVILFFFLNFSKRDKYNKVYRFNGNDINSKNYQSFINTFEKFKKSTIVACDLSGCSLTLFIKNKNTIVKVIISFSNDIIIFGDINNIIGTEMHIERYANNIYNNVMDINEIQNNDRVIFTLLNFKTKNENTNIYTTFNDNIVTIVSVHYLK